MQQVHRAGFVARGTALDKRTEHDFHHSAAYGIHYHGNQEPGEMVVHRGRERAHEHESGAHQHMRAYARGAVTYPVYELSAHEVDKQLYAEIDRDKQRYLGKRYAEFALKCQKKQRREVVDYRLADISGKTRGKREFCTLQCGSAHTVYLRNKITSCGVARNCLQGIKEDFELKSAHG